MYFGARNLKGSAFETSFPTKIIKSIVLATSRSYFSSFFLLSPVCLFCVCLSTHVHIFDVPVSQPVCIFSVPVSQHFVCIFVVPVSQIVLIFIVSVSQPEHFGLGLRWLVIALIILASIFVLRIVSVGQIVS